MPLQAMLGSEEIELERGCSGFDGALVAVSTSGVRVMLVREGTLALRVGRPPSFVETGDVAVTEGDRVTSYSGTVVRDGQPTTVVLTVVEGTDLAPCPDGSSEG